VRSFLLTVYAILVNLKKILKKVVGGAQNISLGRWGIWSTAFLSAKSAAPAF
jgi:hypothetical protein